jgi:hypothetical protein
MHFVLLFIEPRGRIKQIKKQYYVTSMPLTLEKLNLSTISNEVQYFSMHVVNKMKN